MTKASFGIIALILCLGLASAMIVDSVSVADLYPGDNADVKIRVKNILDEDVEDVSLSLSFTNPATQEALPINSVGSSEDNVDELESDDSETFQYKLRASSNADTGEYSILYVLKYKGDSGIVSKTGTIGVTIKGDVKLDYSTKQENPIIGQKGKIILTIVNKGFADAKFVSLNINPSGYTLLSGKNIYIGTISSDDFETIELDVIFKTANPKIEATIEYKNFDNEDLKENISILIPVYTTEKALELGIIKKNNSVFYIIIVISLAILWFVYRKIAKVLKLRKMKKEQK